MLRRRVRWRWRRWWQTGGGRILVWALPSAVAFCWAPSRSLRVVGGGWKAGIEVQSESVAQDARRRGRGVGGAVRCGRITH